MTFEEEARKKWCPVRSKLNNNLAVIVHSKDQPDTDNCIGSDCINWQEINMFSVVKAIPYPDRIAGAVHEYLGLVRQYYQGRQLKPMGYCKAALEA